MPPPLTSAEIVNHPAFDTVIWDLPPTTKGKCAVAATRRGGPFNIAYEIHGTGPIHTVWIMGLGALKWYWQRQTQDFGHKDGSKYSVLIFDNRGMGESDKPLSRYSTSEMARDVLELLEHVGWMGERECHVVGISMGGMIAMELACLEPKRIASLSLVSTCAELLNTVGYFQGLRDRINILIPKPLDLQITEIKSRVSPSWLESPDEEHTFPTNGDRFAAQELIKRQDTHGFTRKGFLLQALAVGYHKKSVKQLREMAERVGRERIQVVHGTRDNLINFEPHAGVLVEALGGEEGGVGKVVFEGRGHYLPMEERGRFRGVVGGLIERTEGMREMRYV